MPKWCRAQLPNIVASVNWDVLNASIQKVFDVRIIRQGQEWKAAFRKSLKGTIVDPSHAHQHERIVTIVGHTSHDVLYQQRFSGEKESEVTASARVAEADGTGM